MEAAAEEEAEDRPCKISDSSCLVYCCVAGLNIFVHIPGYFCCSLQTAVLRPLFPTCEGSHTSST